MVTEHRETERKYEADSALLTLPPLDGLPAVASVSETVEETLEAEYYDTGDLRLIAPGSRCGGGTAERTTAGT
jgi:hypothetical protein